MVFVCAIVLAPGVCHTRGHLVVNGRVNEQVALVGDMSSPEWNQGRTSEEGIRDGAGIVVFVVSV